MLKGMTAFASIKLKEKNSPGIYFEIKGFNHRFLEIGFNLSSGFSYLEGFFKREIEKKIKRGRINVILEIDSIPTYSLNEALAEKYFFLLEKLRKKFSFKESINLDTLINLPGVLKSSFFRGGDRVLERRIKQAFRVVLEKFLDSRKKLGENLYKDLKKRTQNLKEILDNLRQRSNKVIKERAQKIQSAEERTSFLNSSDISEELNLLKFYLNNFQNRLQSNQPIGKELDFIIQEMHREISTLSAKSFDPQVAAYSIKIKTQIEKMREQIQNVE